MQDKKQYDEEYANPPYPGAADDAATIENDAVFGEITDEGPNYRAVCLNSCQLLYSLTDWMPGGMAGNGCHYDEGPGRTGRSFYPRCL